MKIICKNCSESFDGNFCNYCGQSSNTHEINIHFMWHDLQHSFFHFDKGIFFTCKKLFLQPGKMISEYIEGKRIKHFSPISLIVFVASFYALLSYYIIPSSNINLTIEATSDENKITGIKNFINWLNSHFVVSILLTLIFSSIATYFAFYKEKFNIFQHLVINSYITSVQLLIKIILLGFFIFKIENISNSFEIISISLGVIYSFWVITQLFSHLSIYKIILKTILTYFYLSIIYLILSLSTILIADLIN